MDRGKDIGIGINAVEGGYQSGGKILTGKDLRPEVLTVGYQEPNQDTGEKSDGQKGHIAAISGGVPKQQVQPCRNQQGIPGTVKQDKPLAEGDAAIQRELGGPIAVRGKVLYQHESQKIERKPQNVLQLLPRDMGQTQEYHLFICKNFYRQDSIGLIGKSWIFWE